MALKTRGKGLHFKPTDDELISCLLNKVTGSMYSAWCWEDEIGTDDLYGSKEPWDIFDGDDCNEKERYFFTKLKKVGKKTSSNQRFCRNVGRGFWSNKGQKASIFGVRNGKAGIIGYKRGFRYEIKKNCGGQNSMDSSDCWLLREFTLTDTVKRGVKEEYRDYALCLLKRKRKKKGSSEAAKERMMEDDNDRGGEEDMMIEYSDASLCVPKGGSSSGDDDIVEYSAGVDMADWLLQQVEEDDDHAVDLAVPPIDLPAAAALSSSVPDYALCVPNYDDDDRDSPCGDLAIDAAADTCSSSLQEVDESLEVAELLDKSSECSILAAAAPIYDDLSSCTLEEAKKGDTFTEDFDFGFCLEDDNTAPPNDHFAWGDDDDADLFGDYRLPWAGIQMLPVSVL